MKTTGVCYQTKGKRKYAVLPDAFLPDFLHWLHISDDTEVLHQLVTDNDTEVLIPIEWMNYQTCMDYSDKIALCES